MNSNQPQGQGPQPSGHEDDPSQTPQRPAGADDVDEPSPAEVGDGMPPEVGYNDRTPLVEKRPPGTPPQRQQGDAVDDQQRQGSLVDDDDANDTRPSADNADYAGRS